MWGAEDKAEAVAEVGVEEEVEEKEEDDEGRKERKGFGEANGEETIVAGGEKVESEAAIDCKLHLIKVMQNASELLSFSPSDVACRD